MLVTGGSNGIGLAIARAFSDAGAEVSITGTRAGGGDYEEDLSGFSYRQVLVEDGEAVDALITATERVDVLVNNRVNAIAPGWIETNLLTVPVRAAEELNRPIVERTPMARWGKPEEMPRASGGG